MSSAATFDDYRETPSKSVTAIVNTCSMSLSIARDSSRLLGGIRVIYQHRGSEDSQPRQLSIELALPYRYT